MYTPVECVDFIINSVNDLLQKEFATSLTEKDTAFFGPVYGHWHFCDPPFAVRIYGNL